MSYLYELPTTGAISFADFCVDQSTGRWYTTYISDATQARANLRSQLKDNKRTDLDDKDYLKLVKVLDDYFPQLRGIMSCVTSGDIVLTSEPIFSWRTTLSSNLFNTSPRLSLPSLHADLASSLLTYASALSNLARSNVAALGGYERERATSEVDRRAKDDRLNSAVTLLCRAGGVYSYIADTVLPEWPSESPGGTTGRPPDLSSEVNTALSRMALADAQNLAIRKLMSKSASDAAINPGPPLPKSHPSPALIAKLHLECASLYSSALSLVQIPGRGAKSKAKEFLSSSTSTAPVESEVSVNLKRYLSDEATFHGALAKKWLGVDAGESGGSRGGHAVGFLAWAKRELEDLKDGGKGKEKDTKDRRKGRVQEELESLVMFLNHYKKMNDTLTFQPVPSQPELQALIPTGRLAVQAKPYIPPDPAFGPGSVEHTRRQTEALDIAVNSSQGSESRAASAGAYAGAGAYF